MNALLIFDIRVLWRSGLSARAPECQIKNGGLDQYGAEPLKQQQLGTAGVEGVKLGPNDDDDDDDPSMMMSLCVC